MAEKMESGAEYTGLGALLKDSAWLNSEMLPPDRDTVVQIEKTIRRGQVKFKDEVKKGYGSLKFVGKDKELGLNATHIAVLSALFGKMAADWKGKWVALYVDPDVMSFGKRVSAVRIRPERVKPPGKAEPVADRPDIPFEP